MSSMNVLDYGYVKFIDRMGTEETIIEAARMSTSKGFLGWGGKDKPGDEKLLGYLYRNKHMTPFEMCELSLEVQAPIFVLREWMRHRSQSYNEMSARYIQMPNLHYVPKPDRFVSNKSSNKQESSTAEPNEHIDDAQAYVQDEQISIYEGYEEMLKCGVPKEIARLNTPVSRYSRMRVKTDLRNWLGFLNLRMRENAQWEIRQYAVAVADIIKCIWPRTYQLFLDNDLNAVTLSVQELDALRPLMSIDIITAAIVGLKSAGVPESVISGFTRKLCLPVPGGPAL